jgi:two-component system OmpR family sensor kinase
VRDLSTFLPLIQRNASRLSCLVDDLLVVSRLDAGMIVLDEHDVDLVDLVASTVEDLRAHAASRSMTLRLRSTPGPLLRGDSGRLQQVVENLLTNAIKFTEAGTTVELGCTYASGAWTVSVRDHGPGIEPQEQERIFERFYRTRSSTAAGTQGTGLGLTIARGLVALHGGTLTAHSPLGGGAELVCVLPDRSVSPRP